MPSLAFDFHLPASIRFGPGRVRELKEVVASFGRPRVLLLTGSRALEASGALDRILAILNEATRVVIHRRLGGGEPGPEDVDEGAALARVESCRLVIGVGGGAVVDVAKAVAALAPVGEPAEAYIEGVGDGRALDKPGLPCVAVPTTSGTGAEATRNSVLGNRAKGYKRSVRSIHLVPRVVIVDPELTVTNPKAVTAASGMDAIVQLIEAYVSRTAQPFTDALIAGALPGAAEALERAWADGTDLEARSRMAYAALASGIALAHAGLGAVHGLASPVGAMTAVPHGVACARMIAETVRVNAAVLARECGGAEGRGGGGPSTRAVMSAIDVPPSLRVSLARGQTARSGEALDRLAQVGCWLTGATAAADPVKDALAGAARLAAMADALQVPRFREYGVKEADVEAIAAKPGGNLKTNPADLDAEALRGIVRSAM